MRHHEYTRLIRCK